MHENSRIALISTYKDIQSYLLVNYDMFNCFCKGTVAFNSQSLHFLDVEDSVEYAGD